MDFDLVIITADEPYSDNWHTQVIYTEHLSRKYEVLYLAPPSPWNMSKLWRAEKTREVRPGLNVMDYANSLPSAFNFVNEWINTGRVCRFALSRGAKRLLFWHFDSFRSLLNSPGLRREFITRRIYHVTDPFLNNPLDKKLAGMANLVVAANPDNEKYYRDGGADTILVPQGIDLALAKSMLAGKQEIRVRFEKYLVLLGTISDDVDLDALNTLVKSGINVVVTGKRAGLKKSRAAFDALRELPGVQYTGLLHPRQFYPVLKNASGGLVLYTREKRQRGRFAVLKFLHYLAAGIPVISNTDCGVPGLTGHCVHLSEKNDGLLQDARAAITGSLKFSGDAADAYLRSVDLEKLISNILSRLHAV